MASYITLLDPSLYDNNNNPSYNLGDLIINDSVIQVLSELFPQKEVVRISSHQWITERERRIINAGDITFVGGSNILTNDIGKFTRLTPEKRRLRYLFPGFKNVVLIGAGWSAYNDKVDIYTRIYYNKILSWSKFQSVRDSYTQKRLSKIFVGKVTNTCCPTTWYLDDSFANRFDNKREKILFTLTDYDKDILNDSNMIQILLETGKKLVYFVQGRYDLEYLQSLEVYSANTDRFEIIPHDYKAFENFIKSESFNYVGTRLHCGIRCLQFNVPTMILAIDNRAIEIASDINLPTCSRAELSSLKSWLNGQTDLPKLKLPFEDISKWKTQFK